MKRKKKSRRKRRKKRKRNKKRGWGGGGNDVNYWRVRKTAVSSQNLARNYLGEY
jgi:hypothetical protein